MRSWLFSAAASHSHSRGYVACLLYYQAKRQPNDLLEPPDPTDLISQQSSSSLALSFTPHSLQQTPMTPPQVSVTPSIASPPTPAASTTTTTTTTRPQHTTMGIDASSPSTATTTSTTTATAATGTTPALHRTDTAPIDPTADRLEIITAFLQKETTIRPLIGIVCGSGLGELSSCLTRTHAIKYEDIPQFPRSTVAGHAGELVFGWLDETPVVCMRGRFHFYEGYPMRDTTLPIRVMALLGIKYLVVTNAAGGLNADYNVGDIMVINDHLNMPGLAGMHPLVGPNDERFGPRFLPLSECYDRELQTLAHATADRLQLSHRVRHKGVYCFVSGPTYETPTECRLLRLVGGDAVGMSTVPEVIVAAHCGIKVLGLSLVTNKVIFPGDEGSQAASHAEVLEATQKAQRDIVTFVQEILRDVGKKHRC